MSPDCTGFSWGGRWDLNPRHSEPQSEGSGESPNDFRGFSIQKRRKRRQKRRVFNPSFSQAFGPGKKTTKRESCGDPHIPKTPTSFAWRKKASASTLSAKTKATAASTGYTIPELWSGTCKAREAEELEERLDTNQLVE